MNIENNEITLTALQRAKKKYYEKMKSTPEFIKQRNKNALNYYHTKLKSNPEFIKSQSDKKRLYYMNKKTEILFEISV